MRRRVTLVTLALPLLLMAGCGGDGSDGTATEPTSSESGSESPSTEPSPSESTSPSPARTEPQCAEVWVDGARLKGGYQGCYDGDRRVKANGRYCEFGRPLVTYDGQFWAVPTGPIHETDGLMQDKGYRDALEKCSG